MGHGPALASAPVANAISSTLPSMDRQVQIEIVVTHFEIGVHADAGDMDGDRLDCHYVTRNARDREWRTFANKRIFPCQTGRGMAARRPRRAWTCRHTPHTCGSTVSERV